MLFNSYYNAVGEQYDRPSRGLLTRPTHDEITAYRARVDAAVLDLLRTDLDDELSRRIEVGLHHEQQHQELLVTDIKHLLSCNPLEPAYADDRAQPEDASSTPMMRWADRPGGIVRIGCDPARFHYDNEGPVHDALVHPFQIAQRLVTNGEYLEFIEDGGYDRPELWLSEGWQAVQTRGWRGPTILARRRRCADDIHPSRPATASTRGTRRARQLLRSRRIRAVGGRPLADGARVGGRYL